MARWFEKWNVWFFGTHFVWVFFTVQLPSLRFGFAHYVFVGGFCFANVWVWFALWNCCMDFSKINGSAVGPPPFPSCIPWLAGAQWIQFELSCRDTCALSWFLPRVILEKCNKTWCTKLHNRNIWTTCEGPPFLLQVACRICIQNMDPCISLWQWALNMSWTNMYLNVCIYGGCQVLVVEQLACMFYKTVVFDSKSKGRKQKILRWMSFILIPPMTVVNRHGFTRGCVVCGITFKHECCKSQVVSTRFLSTNFLQSAANVNQRQGDSLHFAGGCKTTVMQWRQVTPSRI